MNIELMAAIFWPTMLVALAGYFIGIDRAARVRYLPLSAFGQGLWWGVGTVSAAGVLVVVGVWGV